MLIISSLKSFHYLKNRYAEAEKLMQAELSDDLRKLVRFLVSVEKVLISPDNFLCRVLSLLYPIECPEDRKVLQ